MMDFHSLIASTMVARKDYSVLPTQQAYKVNALDVPPVHELGQSDSQSIQHIRPVMMTNDFHLTWTTGEPGDVVPWHTHMPSVYQALITTQGQCVWHYKDNDGEDKSIRAGPGDVVYLPGGAENYLEVVGDEPHTHIGVYPKTPVTRVEQLVGEHREEGTYDPKEKIPVGLWYDNVRDEVVQKHDSAVSQS